MLSRQLLRGIAALIAAGALMASCSGGETTAPPEPATVQTTVRVATSFPELIRNRAFSGLVSVNRVHAVLLRSDGHAAVDSTLSVASTAETLQLDLNVRISASAPSSGEPMTLEMSYLSADGSVVFRAGPSAIKVTSTSASIAVDAMYSGPGATARSVRITPRALSVDAGGAFTFAATALDAAGAAIPNAPIEWVSVDTARAALSATAVGAGTARGRRGVTPIVARLITGQTDTVFLDVRPVASSIMPVSGNGQTATVGGLTAPTLAQPIVVKVLGADGIGVAGIAVNFAPTAGGSVSPTAAVTDSSGTAQSSWTLANTSGIQLATATVNGLAGSPVTFSATGQPPFASRRLSFITAPAQGISVALGQPFTLTVAALDAAGDIDVSFTGTVSLSVTAGPQGSTISGPPGMPAIAGVATFYYEMIQTPGNGYVITASASGIASGSTPSFNVPASGAPFLYWLTIPFSPFPTETKLTSLAVMRYGGNGVPLSGPVSVVVTAGGGVTTPVPSSPSQSGATTVDWTLGTTPGVNTLTAYSPGLAPVSITTLADFPQLSVNLRLPTLGARQHLVQGASIEVSGLRAANLDVQLTHTQPSVLGIPPSPFRLIGFPSTSFAIEGLAPGTDTVTVSAPKYLTGSGSIRVTLPMLGATALPITATTLDAPADVTLSARDAAGNNHLASDTVVIHAVSSDPSVLRPSQAYIRIPKDQSSVSAAVSFVGAGTAHITYSDSGGHSINYASATTRDVVVTLPSLGLGGYAWTLGARQTSSTYTTVDAPQRVSQALTVNLTSSDTTIATVPATVTIPAGGFSMGFTITSHDVIGSARISATGPGFATVTRTVDVTRPNFLILAPTSLTTVATPLPISVRAVNEEGFALPVTQDVVVTLASLTPSVVTLDITSATIRAGFTSSNQAILSVVGPGTARIVASDARNVPYAFAPETTSFDVWQAALTWSAYHTNIGIGQYFQAVFGIGSPVFSVLSVPIAHSNPGITTTGAAAKVDPAQSYGVLDIGGSAAGTDTITLSAPGYTPASAVVTVGPGQFRLSSWPPSLRVGDSVAVRINTQSPGGTDAFVTAPTTIGLAPSANIQFVSGVPNSAPLTSATIGARDSQTLVYLKAIAAGPATVTVSAPTYTSFTATTTVLP